MACMFLGYGTIENNRLRQEFAEPGRITTKLDGQAFTMADIEKKAKPTAAKKAKPATEKKPKAPKVAQPVVAGEKRKQTTDGAVEKKKIRIGRPRNYDLGNGVFRFSRPRMYKKRAIWKFVNKKPTELTKKPKKEKPPRIVKKPIGGERNGETRVVRAKKLVDLVDDMTYRVSDERKKDQIAVDTKILEAIRTRPDKKYMFGYLGSMFGLRNHMFPHKMKRRIHFRPGMVTPVYYPTESKPKKRSNRKTNFAKHKRNLRKSIQPGTVLIVVAGKHRGKVFLIERVIFLKQLKTGLLLVTGPFKLNRCPLRRINQIFVIATKTKLDISGIKVPDKLNDDYFKRKRPRRAKKDDGDLFETKKETSHRAWDTDPYTYPRSKRFINSPIFVTIIRQISTNDNRDFSRSKNYDEY
uniref:Large ribosomal subunit protein eL6 n=1 Tax=Strigamia maritima TaxID=126957 RepID=T1JBW7_STRMM